MKKKCKDIIISNAKHYSNNTDTSFLGALLKSSLIPLELLDNYLPENGKILDLGCGEGMFSNSLAKLFPNSEIYGVDLDTKKIQIAQACKFNNVTFLTGDALNFVKRGFDAIIFNDMLHHNSYQDQEAFISHAANLLSDGGLLIIKEVDSKDKIDKFMTTFFDKRLYPNDQLNFRYLESWRTLLETNNFEVLTIEVVKHPWIASRTVFVARKSPKPVCYFEGETNTSSIDYNNGKLKVFVTGASGFIGHHMAMHLMENGLCGREVDLVLLARTPIKIERTLREKATIVKCDLLLLKNFGHWKLFDHIDYVFHFAAEVKIHGNPELLIRNNIKATSCLIDVFKGRKLKRFIHASTMGAVDRQPCDPCTNPMNEDMPPHPLTIYGKTKLETERLVQDSGLPHSIVRIPWVFGSCMTPDTHVRNLLERIMRRSLSTRINFPGKVSLIAIEDLVKAFELVAFHPKALNEIFFVAGYPPLSLGELFKKMGRVLIDRPNKLLPVPLFVQFFARKIRRFLPLTIQNLNSDVLCVDDTKIRKLGFQPKRNVDSALIELSAWVHRQRSLKKRIYIVTGAASGIGLELSKKLVAAGNYVILVDKDDEKLSKTANLLDMPALCLDLSLFGDVEHLLHFTRSENELYGLVNCAGIGKKDALIEMEASKIDELIALNISTVVKLTKGALEVFCKLGEGVIVNISSSAALQPLPYFSIYAASKAFVSNFTRSIWYECDKDESLRILEIIPSGTDTSFQASAGVKKSINEKLLSPEYVADKIANLIEKNAQSGTYFIGNRAKIMSLMARVLPIKLNATIWGYLVARMR